VGRWQVHRRRAGETVRYLRTHIFPQDAPKEPEEGGLTTAVSGIPAEGRPTFRAPGRLAPTRNWSRFAELIVFNTNQGNLLKKLKSLTIAREICATNQEAALHANSHLRAMRRAMKKSAVPMLRRTAICGQSAVTGRSRQKTFVKPSMAQALIVNNPACCMAGGIR